MSDAPKPESRIAVWRRRAAILGFVLAMICHLVPPDYRAICETAASICTGGAQ